MSIFKKNTIEIAKLNTDVIPINVIGKKTSRTYYTTECEVYPTDIFNIIYPDNDTSKIQIIRNRETMPKRSEFDAGETNISLIKDNEDLTLQVADIEFPVSAPNTNVLDVNELFDEQMNLMGIEFILNNNLF